MNLFDGTSDQYGTPGSAMPYDSINDRMSQSRNDDDDDEEGDLDQPKRVKDDFYRTQNYALTRPK